MPQNVRIALSISTRSNGAATELPPYRGFVLGIEALAKRADFPFEVEWVLFDDHGDPEQSRLLAETIVADPRFVAVVGPMGSTEAFANAPVFDEAGLLQVSPCGSHPDLCTQGYKTFYRLVPNEEVQAAALATIAREKLDAKTIAIVHDDDAFGTTVSDNLAAAWTAAGLEVVARESFSHGTTDFTELAARVKSANADVVFFGVHATEGLAASEAIRATGVTAPFLGTDGLKTSFFLGGGEPNQEAYHTHSGIDFRVLESAKAFRDDYIARWPEDSTYSPEAFDAVLLIADALEAAGSTDRAAVLEAFRATQEFQGIGGPIRFADNGERLDSPVSWYQVKKTADGKVMEYQGIVS